MRARGRGCKGAEGPRGSRWRGWEGVRGAKEEKRGARGEGLLEEGEGVGVGEGGGSGEKVVKAVKGPAGEGTGVWRRGVEVRWLGVGVRKVGAGVLGGGGRARKMGSGGSCGDLAATGGTSDLCLPVRPPRRTNSSRLTVSNVCGRTSYPLTSEEKNLLVPYLLFFGLLSFLE